MSPDNQPPDVDRLARSMLMLHGDHDSHDEPPPAANGRRGGSWSKAPAFADDPTSWGEAHSSMICSSWKANPSNAGLVSLVNSITSKTGFTHYQASQAIGAGAGVGCPDEASGIEAILAQHPNE